MECRQLAKAVACGALGAVLVLGAAMPVPPDAPAGTPGGTGIQQAQAATSTAKTKKRAHKAKAAYKKFMATKGWKWGTGASHR